MSSKDIHKEILTKQQIELIPYLKSFRRSFYLAGGTAIALHIGHRHSIDFDFFTSSRLNRKRIKEKLLKLPFKPSFIFEDIDQLHYKINDVRITLLS